MFLTASKTGRFSRTTESQQPRLSSLGQLLHVRDHNLEFSSLSSLLFFWECVLPSVRLKTTKAEGNLEFIKAKISTLENFIKLKAIFYTFDLAFVVFEYFVILADLVANLSPSYIMLLAEYASNDITLTSHPHTFIFTRNT